MDKILDNLVNSAVRDENFHTCDFPDAYEKVKEALERLRDLFNEYGTEAFSNGEEHGQGYSFNDETSTRIRAEFEEVLRSL